MKKYQLLFAAAFMAAGCTKLPHIKFDGKVPGLSNAVFMVTDSAGNSLIGQNIENGIIKADTVLENPGYGVLTIKKNGAKDNPVEVYLAAGDYKIEADSGELNRYPKITSSSPIQNELSAYYTIQDELSLKQFQKPMSQLSVAEADMDKIKLQAFKAFTDKYPDSKISAHLLADLKYDHDPAPYKAIFDKLSPEAKNSSIGEGIGKRLNIMMKLLPGSTAPAIAGKTPDGKAFDPKSLDKKVYVVDFWKSGNQISRLNHQEMLSGIINHVDAKKVGFVSISLDTKRDWWTKAIKDDQMTWPQYSDLKGNESADAEAWGITKIPTYYILDGNWKIVERDVVFSRLEFTINDYLEHHR